MDGSTKQVCKVKLADLKPHPRQKALFGIATVSEIEILANDIRDHGLRHPIEVLPDGTILCGHNRVKAAKAMLHWDEIDAIVRHDLAGANDLEIEKCVIADNYCRRQLRPLERARCALRLKELAHGGGLGHLSENAQENVRRNVRGWVGSLLKMSGREVSRLLRVLETPPAIQRAYDDGKLSLVLAGKVAGLTDAQQQQIVQDIRVGVDPKEAVRRITAPAADSLRQAYRRLVSQLDTAAQAIMPHVDAVQTADPEADLAALQSGLTLLENLIARVRDCQRQQEAALEEAAARLISVLDQINESQDIL